MTKPNKGMSQMTEKMKQLTAADPSGRCSFKNLHKLGNDFVQGNEIGIQECVCLLLRQRLVYTTRSVVFINTSLIEQRRYRLKSMEAIEKMEDVNTNIYETNQQMRYVLRPETLENVYLAVFMSKYRMYYGERKIRQPQNPLE